ncbi:MAG TPA: DNA (cytosine-5-)-methyltransferase [Thermomicrobiales bacterium]|nr:DNA (cytosine-5-)-methyltransferase [Thermomicrobiales bacterium]HRA32548.1 DNA (cytosine-5-)-methyltransferase [Thermomicrobiales bacterium]
MAFERAGMTPLWQSEIDRNARRILAHHWPDTPCYEDVTTLDGGAVEPVDVLTGGFPCQDLSVAGRRAGLEGARSGLFWEIVRIIREMREATDNEYPAVVVLENVPGLLSSHRGRDMAVVLWALQNVGAVDIGWRVLDAQWHGVAQRRRRVFIVVDFRGRRAGEILSLAERLSGDSPPSREAREEAAGTLGGGSGQRGWSSDTDRMTFVPLDPSGAVSSKWAKGTGSPAVAFDLQQVTSVLNRQRLAADRPCPTLLQAGGAHVIRGMAVRRLTPRECERLQGFPDDWTTPAGSDSARYKTLGNAVAVPVVERIGRKIVEALS